MVQTCYSNTQTEPRGLPNKMKDSVGYLVLWYSPLWNNCCWWGCWISRSICHTPSRRKIWQEQEGINWNLTSSSLSIYTHSQGTNLPTSSSESSANKTLEVWDSPCILGVPSIVRNPRETKGRGTSKRRYWQGKSANSINSWSFRRWLTPGVRTLGGFTSWVPLRLPQSWRIGALL